MQEGIAAGPGEMMGNAGPGMLAGLRVIEIADERAEYPGLLLAGLGAEVIKIEPPEGNATRRIGPFLEDRPGLERSLFFWNYNRNKKSVVLDLGEGRGREDLLRLLGGADILLDASCGALNTALDLDSAALNAQFPTLVTARMTPFGNDGPWADFKGSDLIHLALGGVMMNCGYDPDPNLEYDTPPIAPQIWHAYHIAGEQLATGIIAALIHRERSGEGQDVSLAIHEAVSKNPEQDIMYWVMRRVPLWRLTNRHAAEFPNHSPGICHTKDGRWFITHGMGARDLKNLVPLLSKYGAQADLEPPPPDADLRARQVPGTAGSDERRAHMLDVVQRFVRAWTYRDMPWREAQDAGLLWAPLRKPHENALDEHWLTRKTFAEVEHPELGRSFRYPTSKWLATKTSWQVGRRAPLLGEDTAAVLGEPVRRPSIPARPAGRKSAGLSTAQQAVPAARDQDPRFRLVSRVHRRHALSRRNGRGELHGRVEGQSRHAAGGDGAGRRPRRARCRDRSIARRARSRHGRPIQQQECRQARHLVEHPASQRTRDRQGHGAYLRCRGGGVLARRIAAARAGL
jgi:crotonobetainyl-CoA:carnitine CoA-transferase CaiB-like acyl-CoA transferase